MDYDTISADAFGAGLRGFGINLLVVDIAHEVAFLSEVFGMIAHRVSADYAIMVSGETVFQLHSDGTYHANPLLSSVPETPPRGGGAELRLYDISPEDAVDRATVRGDVILQPPTDKPHGLCEAYILSPSGYAWVPSRPLRP